VRLRFVLDTDAVTPSERDVWRLRDVRTQGP
jgi:hypothetical protein